MSDRHARRLVQSARVFELTGPLGPTNEAQARELAPLLNRPEELADVWREANARAERSHEKVTASLIRDVVGERLSTNRSEESETFLAYIFGCERPVPARFYMMLELIDEWLALESRYAEHHARIATVGDAAEDLVAALEEVRRWEFEGAELLGKRSILEARIEELAEWRDPRERLEIGRRAKRLGEMVVEKFPELREVATGVSDRPSAAERVRVPEALLSRSDLREPGLERRAVDVVFRECPIVVLPGYKRPLVRVADYLALLDGATVCDRCGNRDRPT